MGRDLLLRDRPWGWIVPTVAGTIVVLGVGIASLSAPDGRPTWANQFGPATVALADGAAEALDPEGTYALEVPETPIQAMVPLALALELERRGVDVVSPARLADMLGSHRVGDGSGTDGRLILHQGASDLPVPTAGTRLASFDPEPDDLARLERAQAAVLSVVEANGGLTLDDGETSTTYSSEAARQLVADGGLVSFWELDMVREPAIDRSLMAELRAAQSGPVVPFALDLLPVTP